VAAARDRQQLIRHAGLGQRIVQPNRVLIRHHAIGIADAEEDTRSRSV
jgi:hypothetical protein